MKNFKICCLILALWSQVAVSGAIISQLKEGSSGDSFFATVEDAKRNQLSLLQKNFEDLQKSMDSFTKDAEASLARYSSEIAQVKEKTKQDPRNEEFFNNKLSILNELYQITKDKQQAKKQQVESVQDHIKILQDYLKDPNLSDYVKKLYNPDQSIYSFEDLQQLNRLVLSQKNKVLQLEKQSKNSNAELESRTSSAQAAKESLQQKKDQLKAFVDNPNEKGPEELFGFESGQKIELLKIQEQLLLKKSELAQLRLDVAKKKVDALSTKLFVAKLRLKTLEKTVTRIRPFVNIKEDDVAQARVELNKKKQKSLAVKNGYRRQEERLAKENEASLQELTTLAKQYTIKLGSTINDWSLEPMQSADSYIGLVRVGNANSLRMLSEKNREIYEALISLEDEKNRYQELLVDVKKTFFLLKTKENQSEEWREKEVKKYNLPGVELNATIARFKERENAASGMLKTQKTARENIKSLLEDLQKKRTTVFAGRQNDYNQLITTLKSSAIVVERQIAAIERLMSIYKDIVTTAENAKEQIVFIVNELQAAIGILKRSEEAIKIQELKNVVPDVKRFALDFFTYMKGFSIRSFMSKVSAGLPQGVDFLWLIVQLLLLVAVFIVIKRYAATSLLPLLDRLRAHKGFGLLGFLLTFFVRFFTSYYLSIYAWIFLFSFIKFGVIPDYGLQILFYLCSIPYFLYLANRFLSQLFVSNKKEDYIIFAQQFQFRFYAILSVLLYSTIFIQFFRTAFLLGPYRESGLPIILLALNFIILQVCLIFVITKEQILSLIPTKTETWKYVYDKVDKFFYLILAAIVAMIVMINPYVGFGKLVLHILSRTFLTLLFFPLFFWAQMFFKKIASKIFFSTRDDVVQERFGSAKSWYGLFVIVSFALLLLVGFVLGAKIWGWPIAYKDIGEWMQTEIIRGEGEKIVSPVSFFYVLVFIISGFLVAFAFNKFVLKRIFDLLLVGMGIQQAMIGLARYLIIIAFIMIGLENVGLGGLTKNLWLTLLGVGWIVREPLGDLVAYFIILIQRPFKIGDYIQIDEQTSGIVRRISPRSVLLRQKNSTSIVVPNALALSKAVVNWNYVSGFIAVNDILVSINYDQDPERVLELIQKAVDAHPRILKSPKAIIRLEDFGEYGFKFLIRAFISSHLTLDMWQIAGEMRVLIVKTLRAEGIDIAIPIWHTTADQLKKKETHQGVLSEKKTETKKGD